MDLGDEVENCWGFGFGQVGGVEWFCSGRMGDFRCLGSVIFTGECGGMTIRFAVGNRFFFGENIPIYRKM